MKLNMLLAIPAALMLIGCGDSKTEPAKEVSTVGSVVSAPTEYLGAVANSRHSAVKTIDTVSINNAIQLFSGEHGRYPNDLNELVEKKYIKEIPQPPAGMKISYDAKAGTVTIAKP